MTGSPASNDLEQAWDERVAQLTGRLSPRIRRLVQQAEDPRRWIARRGLGLLFILGTLMSVPRNKGLWMLPIGLTLLCEGLPGWKASAERWTRKLDPTLSRLNPWWRRAMAPSIEQPTTERVRSGPNKTDRTFTRISAELIPPPWQKFPNIPLGSLGWRMGEAEEYTISFDDWLERRTPDENRLYALTYPEPSGWEGFYARRGMDLTQLTPAP